MNKEEAIQSRITLAQNLKKLMVDKKISQVSLSKKASMNNSTLHGYLNGVVPSGIIGLIRISDFFEISLDELILGNAKPQYTSTENELILMLQKYELVLSIKNKQSP